MATVVSFADLLGGQLSPSSSRRMMFGIHSSPRRDRPRVTTAERKLEDNKIGEWEMPRRRTASGVMSSFSLQEAISRNETCDLFVSHKKEDETSRWRCRCMTAH